MSETGISRAAEVRAKLEHPLIDGDSHIVEFMPVFLDFLKEAGGSDAVQRFGGAGRSGRKNWYQMTWDERRQQRVMRPPWWALPTKNTLDRATSMLPKLYHERMDDVGLDFAVLYPSVGLGFPHHPDDEFRVLACHAFNEYTAASYGEYSDRMTVAAAIPLHSPEEGIRELEHAKALGLKVAMIPSYVRRPVEDVADKYPELARRVTWLDSYGIDSTCDYDPFWAKCEELGFAVASHSGGMGFDDRRSISTYMYNHMGHFAAAGEVLCKSLLMGGVTRRFPKLRVALLEGGVVNGSRLYADIFSRWEKRSLAAQENLDPANLDLELARDLFERHGDAATLAKLDQLERTLGLETPDIPAELRDDFSAMQVEKEQDLRDLFIPPRPGQTYRRGSDSSPTPRQFLVSGYPRRLPSQPARLRAAKPLPQLQSRVCRLLLRACSVAGGSRSSSPLARRSATGFVRRRRCSVTSFPTAILQRSSSERLRCWSRTRSGRGSQRRLHEGARRLRGRTEPRPDTFRRTSSEPSVPATGVAVRSSE